MASDPRDGVRRLVEAKKKKAAFRSAPRFIPVNLFSKFQVDSPWRIMTTVDFRRAPERRARWVARSNMVLLWGRRSCGCTVHRSGFCCGSGA